MNVTLVTMAYPHPRSGFWPGIERQVGDFAAALHEAGAAVNVITSFRNGGSAREDHRGIKIFRVEDRAHRFGRPGYLMNGHVSSLAANALKVEEAISQADVIESFIPLPASRVLERPGLLLFGFFPHRDRPGRWADYLHLPWHFRMQRDFFARARGVIVASAESRRVLVEEYDVPESKIEVVPLGVASRFLDVTSQGQGRGGAPARLLFVGPLIPRKGLRTLVDSIPLLAEAGHPFRVILAGHGPEREELERRAKRLGIDNLVEFKGFVPEEELVDLYSSSDIFVFPSLKEGFGLVLIEAMACGLPVVASAVPPLTEVVGEAGLHFKPGDPEDLARVLTGLLSDPGRLAAVGSIGRQRVRDNYLWKAVAERTLGIFERARAA